MRVFLGRSIISLTMTLSVFTKTTPRIVGLTGGIASGKSLACTMFASLGVPTLDIDLVARAMHQDPFHPATRALAAAVPHAMTIDGALRRGSLRTLFARDEVANAALKKQGGLSGIGHPC